MRVAFTHQDHDFPLYAESIGYDWEQEQIERRQGYPYYHWLQTTSGIGLIEVGGEIYTLKKGQGILLAPNVPHAYHRSTSEWQTSYLTFSGTIMPDMATFLDLKQYRYFNHLDQRLMGFIPEHYNRFLNHRPDSDYDVATILYEFMMLLHQTGRLKVDPQVFAVVAVVLDFLEQHYTEAITNSRLEALTGYTPQYLNRLFKEYYRLTPLQYLTEIRLRAAKSLLLTRGELNIQDISEQVGFGDTSQFIQKFRRSVGKTPLKFRQQFS